MPQTSPQATNCAGAVVELERIPEAKADATIACWQNRLNGLQKVVACGCHLNRPVADLVEQGGFRFESVRTFYAKKAPRTHGWVTTGAALKA